MLITPCIGLIIYLLFASPFIYFSKWLSHQLLRLTNYVFKPPTFDRQSTWTRYPLTIPDYLDNLGCKFNKLVVGSRQSLGNSSNNPKISIKTDYQWINHQEWLETINRFSHGLKFDADNSLEVGDKVCIFADTQASWLMSALAIMKSGYVVTTAYATLGVDALIFSLNQTESKVLITQSNLYESVIQHIITKVPSLEQIIFLDQYPSQLTTNLSVIPSDTFDSIVKHGQNILNRSFNDENVKFDDYLVKPDDLAMIMYTSGTTGNPKGIMITHSQLCNAINSMTDTLPESTNLCSKDRVLAYLPLAHILELVMELSVLNQGGEIAYGEIKTLSDDTCVNDKGQKSGDLSLAQPTLFAGVPKVYNRTYETVKSTLVKHSQLAQIIFKVSYWLQHKSLKFWGCRLNFFDKYVFKSIQKQFGGRIRLFLSGGSALSGETQEFMSVVGGAPLIQGYGLTETCCTGTLEHPDNYFQNNIGLPVRGVKLKLQDCLELGYTSTDPLGASGEVMIYGDSVSCGYYKEPKLTEESFENSWFSTGDIGRLLPNGNYKLIDRKKDLVKLVHGEYIALSHLESKYINCDGVENICLIGNGKLSNPVAIIVSKPNFTPDTLKTNLRQIAKDGKFKSYEYIETIVLVDDVWTIENKCLTDTMKIKRNEIYKKYKEQIQSYL